MTLDLSIDPLIAFPGDVIGLLPAPKVRPNLKTFAVKIVNNLDDIFLYVG